MNATNPNDSLESRGTQSAADTAASAERLRSAAHDRIDHVAESMHPAVDRLSSAAHETVERVTDAATHAAERMHIKSDELRTMQDRLTEDCRTYVRAHPLKALGYAAAAGFILTRLLRG